MISRYQKETTKVVQFRLENSKLDKLDVLSTRLKLSRAGLIQKVVSEYINKNLTKEDEHLLSKLLKENT
jgi:hypothetical protein